MDIFLDFQEVEGCTRKIATPLNEVEEFMIPPNGVKLQLDVVVVFHLTRVVKYLM